MIYAVPVPIIGINPGLCRRHPCGRKG